MLCRVFQGNIFLVKYHFFNHFSKYFEYKNTFTSDRDIGVIFPNKLYWTQFCIFNSIDERMTHLTVKFTVLQNRKASAHEGKHQIKVRSWHADLSVCLVCFLQKYLWLTKS